MTVFLTDAVAEDIKALDREAREAVIAAIDRVQDGTYEDAYRLQDVDGYPVILVPAGRWADVLVALQPTRTLVFRIVPR